MRKKINEMKGELISAIIDFLKGKGINELYVSDIYPGSDDSPIVIEGRDDDDTFTLDSIELDDELGFTVCASSCDDDTELNANKISVDVLDAIYTWLEDYEDSIDEYLEEENEE